jgi:hypothetical protein
MQVSFIQIQAYPVMYTLWKWRLKIAALVFQQPLLKLFHRLLMINLG